MQNLEHLDYKIIMTGGIPEMDGEKCHVQGDQMMTCSRSLWTSSLPLPQAGDDPFGSFDLVNGINVISTTSSKKAKIMNIVS